MTKQSLKMKVFDFLSLIFGFVQGFSAWDLEFSFV